MIRIRVEIIGPRSSGKTDIAGAIGQALYEITPGPEYDVEIHTSLGGDDSLFREFHATQVRDTKAKGLAYGERWYRKC